MSFNFNPFSYFSWSIPDPDLAEVTPVYTVSESAAIMACDIRDEFGFLGVEHWRIACAAGASAGIQALNIICRSSTPRTRKALKCRLIALASTSLLAVSYTAMALMGNFCETTYNMELDRESDARDYRGKYHMGVNRI